MELFDGQLSLNDIYNCSYKELGYLKKHREAIRKAKNESGASITDALSGVMK